MRIKVKHTSVNVGVLFAGVLALMLALDKTGVCAGGILACVLHEAGHLACLVALRSYPGSVTLSFYGMRIDKGNELFHSQLDEILIAASGPAANFLVSILLLPFNKLFSAVNLLTGLFNSLPCLPLDGGRVAYCALLPLLGEKKAAETCFVISVATLCICIAGGLALLLYKGNFTLLAVSLYLIYASKYERKDIV